MKNIANEIKNTARMLLAEGKADVVIGFERGTLPLRATPCFIRTAAETERLIWDETCINNLAKYAREVPGKKAIVVKGCDSRVIAMLLSEGQLSREELILIGVPCRGMADARKIETDLGEIFTAERQDGKFIINAAQGDKTYSLAEILDSTCANCRYPNPVLSDITIGEAIERPLKTVAEDFADVAALEKQAADAREAYFKAEMAKCVRCYACRNACPLCYCPECFVDCNTPRWLSTGADKEENLFFHLGRVFHLAGRCADCGACDRACPNGVDVRSIGRKASKDVLDFYNHEAGIGEDGKPALNEYSPDDPQQFLVKE